MYDVMLYAIAGVVLVLILEQFVQMGVHLGKSAPVVFPRM